MKRGFLKRLIKQVLIIGMTFLVTVSIFFSNKRPTTKSVDANQITAEQSVVDLNQQQECINNSLKSVGSLIVSQGQISMSYTFSNDNDEVMGQESTNWMKCIQDKLTKRKIKFKSLFNYNVVYDLSVIKTEIKEDKIIIHLNAGNLEIKDITEDKENSCVSEEYGWVTKDFTPNEIRAMEKQCLEKTRNYLVTDTNISDKAMNNLESNIKDICKKFNVKDYEIVKHSNDTITNKDKFTEIN